MFYQLFQFRYCTMQLGKVDLVFAYLPLEIINHLLVAGFQDCEFMPVHLNPFFKLLDRHAGWSL